MGLIITTPVLGSQPSLAERGIACGWYQLLLRKVITLMIGEYMRASEDIMNILQTTLSWNDLGDASYFCGLKHKVRHQSRSHGHEIRDIHRLPHP